MVLAVVEAHPHVDDREAEGAAVGHRLDDPFLDRWDELAGDRPAPDLVDELETVTSTERFHLEEADAELAVAPGLFLVPTFGIRGARDRLAVRHLHRHGLDADAEFSLETFAGDGEVGLAHAPQQRLSRLAVSLEAQRTVLLEDAAKCVRQLVLVGLCPGPHGGRQHGFGPFRRGDAHRLVLGRQGVARLRVREFGHGDDVAGRCGRNHCGFLAVQGDESGETLVGTRPHVGQRRFGFERSGDHLQQGDLTDVGIGEGLERKGERFRIGVLVDRDRLIAHFELNRRAIERRRPDLDDEVREPVDGDGAGGRTADDREHRRGGDPVRHRVFEVFDRRDLSFEIRLEQFVVGDDDPLDEVVVHLVFPLFHLLRDLHLLGVTRVVHIGLVSKEIRDPMEGSLVTDRQFDGCDSGAEAVPDLLQGPIERGPFLVELVDEEHAWHAETGSDVPGVFGLDFDSLDRAHHEDCKIGDPERGVDVPNEVRVSGCVDEVDLVTLPRERCSGEGERHAATVFFGIRIGDRVAVFDATQSADRVGPEQKRFGEGRLAGSAVSDERHIADLLRGEHLHCWGLQSRFSAPRG